MNINGISTASAPKNDAIFSSPVADRRKECKQSGPVVEYGEACNLQKRGKITLSAKCGQTNQQLETAKVEDKGGIGDILKKLMAMFGLGR